MIGTYRAVHAMDATEKERVNYLHDGGYVLTNFLACTRMQGKKTMYAPFGGCQKRAQITILVI